MARDDWARLLASLCDDDVSRREALLMLSDEDWVSDDDRDWLRKAARRSSPLHPSNSPAWMFDSYAWIDDKNRRATVPVRVGRRLNMPESPVLDYTDSYDSLEAAWADLLQAISEESRS